MKLFLTALALVAVTTPAAAQWLDRPWAGIPRTADGKPNLTAPAPRGPDGKPDLTGIWNGPTPDPLLDLANAQPWVNDLVRQRGQDYHRGRPSFQCRPSGLEADEFGGGKRFLQTPTTLVILDDDLTYRVIHMTAVGWRPIPHQAGRATPSGAGRATRSSWRATGSTTRRG